jgi:hypothetical protein
MGQAIVEYIDDASRWDQKFKLDVGISVGPKFLVDKDIELRDSSVISLKLFVGLFLPFMNLLYLLLSFLFQHLSQIIIESTKLD